MAWSSGGPTLSTAFTPCPSLLNRLQKQFRHFTKPILSPVISRILTRSLKAVIQKTNPTQSKRDSEKDGDLKQMYDQLKYKDSRIIDLNQVIMEKERKIMDLQEACREQGQVAQSKQQAVQIVNRRLQVLSKIKHPVIKILTILGVRQEGNSACGHRSGSKHATTRTKRAQICCWTCWRF